MGSNPRTNYFLGGSLGLVVKGGYSCSEGCGFKSQHRLLDGQDFTYICCINYNVCLKRPNINKKSLGLAQFHKKLFYFLENLNFL